MNVKKNGTNLRQNPRKEIDGNGDRKTTQEQSWTNVKVVERVKYKISKENENSNLFFFFFWFSVENWNSFRKDRRRA